MVLGRFGHRLSVVSAAHRKGTLVGARFDVLDDEDEDLDFDFVEDDEDWDDAFADEEE